MNPANAPTWHLRHAWTSGGDRAALAACAEQLAAAGIEFADAPDDEGADAVKLHGAEMVDGWRRGTQALADLRGVADAARWADAVDPRAWRFMAQGDTVLGIPIGIHRSNAAWAHAPLADALARTRDERTTTLPDWLAAAAREIPRPLAVGREPWQVGILFEALFVAHDPETYRRAFAEGEREALADASVREVLEQLAGLRAFVDDARMALPWREQLALVDHGAAAMMLMGDWAGVAGLARTRRLSLARLHDRPLHVVDFFCPLASAPQAVALRAAGALTEPAFQARMAAIKGCAPAVTDAPRVDAADPRSLPSLTFEQCRGAATTQAMLAVVAEHFLRPRPAAHSARLLAAAAAG